MPCNLDRDYLDFNNAVLTKKEEVLKAYWEVFKNSYGLTDEQAGGLEKNINKIQLKISDTAQKELFAVSSDYELLTN